MDEFYKNIQMFLMKKNQECGELKYIASRTTEENNKIIEDLCSTIKNLCNKAKLLQDPKHLRVNYENVQAFKYFVLNTNFKTQELLTEDFVNGHLVDMCPPLSPYLMIQICWYLEYEDILTESLLHMPLNLSMEIIEISRTCLEDMEINRALDTVFQLITNAYKSFVLLRDVGTEVENFETLVDQCTANFQELLIYLTGDSKLVNPPNSTKLAKHEHVGLILKRILSTCCTCFETNLSGVQINADIDKMYKISYSRTKPTKYQKAEEIMSTLNQELINLFLKKIKEIDCNIYMSWVEINDRNNPAISLQRSIGNDCYRFLQSMKNYPWLLENEHLIQCLSQFSSKPENESTNTVLSLQELYHNATKGEKASVKELMSRYKEWDNSTIKYFQDLEPSLLDKQDYLYALEYLTLILKQSKDQELKHETNSIIMKKIIGLGIFDLYELVVEHITKHNGSNIESTNNIKSFHKFINHQTSFRSPKTLRAILCFLLKSPKNVMTVLLKITIGYFEYRNIMIPAKELSFFSSIMNINEDQDETFLTNTLKDIFLENIEWNPKKFLEFINFIIDAEIIRANQLIDKVFVPVLLQTNNSHLNPSNLQCILHIIKQHQNKYVIGINSKNLFVSLAKQLACFRKSIEIPKYTASEILFNIERIMKYWKQYLRSSKIDIEVFLEPIDIPIWKVVKNKDVFDMIQDYERRYFLVSNIIQHNWTIFEKLGSLDVKLTHEDFLRHLIIRATETEYQEIAFDLTFSSWVKFGCNSEFEACEKFLRCTIEACCFTLDHPTLVQKNTFEFILRCLARFANTFINIDGITREKKQIFHQIMLGNIETMYETIKKSYPNLLDTDLLEFHTFNDLAKSLCNLADHCSQSTPPNFTTKDSNITPRYIAHHLACACTMIDFPIEIYKQLSTINKLFDEE